MRSPHAAGSGFEIWLLLSAVCASGGESEEKGRPPPFSVREMVEQAGAEPKCTEPPVAEPSRARTEAGVSLSLEEIQRALSLLPPFEVSTIPAAPPAAPPPGALPPREAGAIEAPLNADGVPPVSPAGKGRLEVIRRLPEGDIDDAMALSVTFSEPMAPLALARELDPSEVPVRFTPEVKGSWRWLGTSTLLFEPREGRRRVRFPRATRFEVEVPAGTRSSLGHAIEERIAWTFSTPPPRALVAWPRRGQVSLDPLFFVVFNQPIDREAALSYVRLRAGEADFPVRLATQEEVDAERRLRAPADFLRRLDSAFYADTPPTLLELAAEGGWLAFRAKEKLPPASRIRLRIEEGVPALEGGRRMEEAREGADLQMDEIETFGPLKVEGVKAWAEGEPRAGFDISLTNSLDEDAFRSDMIRIEPPIEGISIRPGWTGIEIEGLTRPGTTYVITISPELRDTWGQTLGKEARLEVPVKGEPKALWIEAREVLVLDPARPRTFPVYSVNEEKFRLRAFRVTPEHFDAYLEYSEEFRDFHMGRDGAVDPDLPPGEPIADRLVSVDAKPHEPVATFLDLEPFLEEGLGHVVLLIEATPEEKKPWRRYPAWIQSTRISLTTYSDADRVLVWANSTENPAPLDRVSLELWPGGSKGLTGLDGIASLPLVTAGRDQSRLLIGRLGKDAAVLRASNHRRWGEKGHDWMSVRPEQTLRWFAFTDRGLYRPGETVHSKGWLRREAPGPKGDLELPGEAISRIAYSVTILGQGRDGPLAHGEAALTALGGFALSFVVPPDVSSSWYEVDLRALGPGGEELGKTSVDFRVGEIRRPEFAVHVTKSEGPYLGGGSAEVAASARYYTGEGLARAGVSWAWASKPAHVSVPEWEGFTFGTWTPWQDIGENLDSGAAVHSASLRGLTSESGKQRLLIDFARIEPPRPMLLSGEAKVADVNRQEWGDSTSFIVHPASLQLGLRAKELFLQEGERLRFEAVVTDLFGAAVEGAEARFECARVEWTGEGRDRKARFVDPVTTRAVSGAKPIDVVFESREVGQYRVLGTVVDSGGRRSESELRVWVYSDQLAPNRYFAEAGLRLIPERTEYLPGETAKVRLLSPFAPAEGLLLLCRSGILHAERFRLESPSKMLEIPITDSHFPSLEVWVVILGRTARVGAGGIPDPAATWLQAPGESLELKVSPSGRRLEVEVKPAKEKVEPGAAQAVEILVRDAAGAPVRDAEVCVVAVDASVLELTGHDPGDPLLALHDDRPSGVGAQWLLRWLDHSRPESVLAEWLQPRRRPVPQLALVEIDDGRRRPVEFEEVRQGPRDAPPSRQPLFSLRRNFNPLALFAASLRTDGDGRARSEVELPGNVTRYDVSAVAAAHARNFGKGQSEFTARLPLMLRPSLPRFLRMGDKFELPLVVQNASGAPLDAEIAVRGENVAWEGPEHEGPGVGRRVHVAAGGRVELRFDARPVQAGTLRVQAGVRGGSFSDAAEVSIPVYAPAATLTSSTYFELDGDGAIRLPVEAAAGRLPDFGGLEVFAACTAASSLEDAASYVIDYPHGCTEQIASRLIVLCALKRLSGRVKMEGLPAGGDLDALAAKTIRRLEDLSRGKEGFGLWAADPVNPYVSVHAARALVEAREAGWAAPGALLEDCAAFLAAIDKRFDKDLPVFERRAIQAYGTNVLSRMADAAPEAARSCPERARELIEEGGLHGLSLESLAWLWPVLAGDPASSDKAEAVRRRLISSVAETAGEAHFAETYISGGEALLHSSPRTDGVVLGSLLEVKPRDALAAKVARGLLSERKAGRWRNTQENGVALSALSRYLAAVESEAPDFKARLWVGGDFMGESGFDGSGSDHTMWRVPLDLLGFGGGTKDLLVEKQGAGRLHCRVSLTQAVNSSRREAVDQGWSVERDYEAVGEEGGVELGGDGVWRVRAGALIRVRISFANALARNHVALVDPLPAGLEVVQREPPRISTPEGSFWGKLNKMKARKGRWFDSLNFRDDRAEAFAVRLPEGVHEHTYHARATTPGVFVAPPARLEEMYNPETSGQSSTDVVVVAE